MLRRSAVRASCRSPDSTSPTRTTCCGQVASILVATSSHTPDFLVTYVIATSSRGCYAETVPVDISFIQYIRSSIDRTAGFLCSAFTIYKLYYYLACSANLPGWLYILPIFFIFFLFLMVDILMDRSSSKFPDWYTGGMTYQPRIGLSLCDPLRATK